MLFRINAFFNALMLPPHQDHADFHEHARYLLAYRMCLFLTIILSVLGVLLYYFYGPEYSILTFLGLASVIISLVIIRKTGTYKSFSLFFCLFGMLLCQLTLFVVHDQPHIVDGLWMIINIQFAFLTINKKWGIFIALGHGIAISLFYYFLFNEQIELLRLLDSEQLFGMAINVLFCFLIILFLSLQGLQTNLNSENHLHKAQQALQKQLDTIHKQNEEKTVMLKEIHHRVKNNLQVITSLLRLQSRELENEEAISKFRDTTNRVIAMSIIHEKMYQSRELSKINLEEYFRSLATDLLSSYQVDLPVKVTILCKLDSLGMKPIVPLALIFNELFSNSLKYAFEATLKAEIYVELIEEGDNDVVLIYRDNGQWKTPARNDSFGLELIDALTEQLEGEMDFTCSPETVYRFLFRNMDRG
jgi:two-component sensor histidine kinase